MNCKECGTETTDIYNRNYLKNKKSILCNRCYELSIRHLFDDYSETKKPKTEATITSMLVNDFMRRID